MGYIYCIENKINGHKYVGKTLRSIENRFRKHIRDSSKKSVQNRPLYRAFKKYGINNFKCYILEECDNNILSDREIYWIDKLGSYIDGYNATLGGDGKQLYTITYEDLWSMYEKHMTPKEIANHYHCCADTISIYSKQYGINWMGHSQRHDIICIKDGEEFKKFHSAGEAARWLIQNNQVEAKQDSISGNIMRCCKKERFKSYGFEWKFDVPR